MNLPTDVWSIQNTGAATVAATVSRAAVAATKHCIFQITISHAAGATAGTPVTYVVRDGATGAGTILWAATISSPANTSKEMTVGGLNLVGTANTAMTIESITVGAAATIQSVTAQGYDLPA